MSWQRRHGRLIALEGTDGSGKTTQFKLLLAALRRAGRGVAAVDFPQYGKPSARLVGQYLRGEFGPAQRVSPYQAALFYAVDRLEAAPRIRRWLEQGRTVIANRYTWSNLAHQGGKFRSAPARRKFWRWVLALEHEALGIPKPNATVFLHLPAAHAQVLVGAKRRRGYLRGKRRDIHERDLGHLRAAERAYVELAHRYRFRTVECAGTRGVLTPEAIHRKVMHIINHRT